MNPTRQPPNLLRRMSSTLVLPTGGMAAKRSKSALLLFPAAWPIPWIALPAGMAGAARKPTLTANAAATSRPALRWAKRTIWPSTPPCAPLPLTKKNAWNSANAWPLPSGRAISSAKFASKKPPTWFFSWSMPPGRWRSRSACRPPKAPSYPC